MQFSNPNSPFLFMLSEDLEMIHKKNQWSLKKAD